MFAHLGGCLWCEGEGLSHCVLQGFDGETLLEAKPEYQHRDLPQEHKLDTFLGQGKTKPLPVL